MLTTLLIYYGGCAKVVEHLPESDGKSSGTDDYGSSSYDDNLGFDGEPNGMPYMP